jgi:transposase
MPSMARRKNDPKAEVLRQRGCLHLYPEKVADELFVANEFFDPRDLLQVKYEMLRRVRQDDHTISQAAANFGLSRPTFYQAQAAYEAGGLPALLPKKPGPRRAHKLSEEIVEALRQIQDKAPNINTTVLAEQVRDRFGVSIHPRSIERALARKKKKRQP